MRLRAILALGAALGAVAAPGAAQAQVSPDQAAELGREAYRYGIPLLEMLRIRTEMTSVRAPDGRGNAPVNAFSHARKFATPRDRTVVAPNVDTLYSISHLDLGKGPIVLSHPDMGRATSTSSSSIRTRTCSATSARESPARTPDASRSCGRRAARRRRPGCVSSARPTGASG